MRSFLIFCHRTASSSSGVSALFFFFLKNWFHTFRTRWFPTWPRHFRLIAAQTAPFRWWKPVPSSSEPPQGFFWRYFCRCFWCEISCFLAGKKVTVRAPAPALASLTKPRHSSRPLLSSTTRGVGAPKPKKGVYASNRKSTGDLQERPLRERVTHLLALRPYKRPELILRLQADGLTAGDKDMLDSVMMEVILSRITPDNTAPIKMYKLSFCTCNQLLASDIFRDNRQM